MIKCYNCDSDMIWGNDFHFDECGYVGEGIVTSFTCPKCDTYAEFVIPERNKKYSEFM